MDDFDCCHVCRLLHVLTTFFLITLLGFKSNNISKSTRAFLWLVQRCPHSPSTSLSQLVSGLTQQNWTSALLSKNKALFSFVRFLLSCSDPYFSSFRDDLERTTKKRIYITPGVFREKENVIDAVHVVILLGVVCGGGEMEMKDDMMILMIILSDEREEHYKIRTKGFDSMIMYLWVLFWHTHTHNQEILKYEDIFEFLL